METISKPGAVITVKRGEIPEKIKRAMYKAAKQARDEHVAKGGFWSELAIICAVAVGLVCFGLLAWGLGVYRLPLGKPGVPYNIKTPPEPQNRIVIYDHVGARHHASIPDSASEFEAILGRYRVRVEVLGEKP